VVLPLLEAILEGFFWNGMQLRHRILYDVLTAVRTKPFSNVFNFGKSQKLQGATSAE
jgi:hypothetical protein